MKIFFVLFWFSVGVAQNSNKTLAEKPFDFTAPIDEMVGKLTKDFYSAATAALIVANNGSISQKVEIQIQKNLELCRTQLSKVDTNEYGKSLGNFLSGAAPSEMLTPAIYSVMQGCSDDMAKDLALVDKNLIIPDKDLKYYSKHFSDPRTMAELKKINPNNMFLNASLRAPLVKKERPAPFFQDKQIKKPLQPPTVKQSASNISAELDRAGMAGSQKTPNKIINIDTQHNTKKLILGVVILLFFVVYFFPKRR